MLTYHQAENDRLRTVNGRLLTDNERLQKENEWLLAENERFRKLVIAPSMASTASQEKPPRSRDRITTIGFVVVFVCLAIVIGSVIYIGVIRFAETDPWSGSTPVVGFVIIFVILAIAIGLAVYIGVILLSELFGHRFQTETRLRRTLLDNQHLRIRGYRDLSQDEIDLMNEIKAKGEDLGALCDRLAHADSQRIDQRWAAIGKTHLQQGIMALVRAVAQPTTF